MFLSHIIIIIPAQSIAIAIVNSVTAINYNYYYNNRKGPHSHTRAPHRQREATQPSTATTSQHKRGLNAEIPG